MARWRGSEKEEEVERETAFLQGVVISWPSSCFSAGTSFVLQRAGTTTHTHTHTHTHTYTHTCTCTYTCTWGREHCGKGHANVPSQKLCVVTRGDEELQPAVEYAVHEELDHKLDESQVQLIVRKDSHG